MQTRRHHTLPIAAASAVALVVAAGFAVAQDRGKARTAAKTEASPAESPNRAQVRRMLAEWPEKQQTTARTLMKQYGDPDEATASMLIWHDNGPWKRTTLYREAIPHEFPKPHEDYLEQVINYQVPTDKFDELAAYDGSVIAARTNGELAARCDKEAMNFLALNLADGVVKGEHTVDEARKQYARTVKAVSEGKKPKQVRSFQFEAAKSPKATRDPDRSIMKQVTTR